MNDIKLNSREQAGILCSAIAIILVVFLAVYIPNGPRKKYKEAQTNLTIVRGELLELQLMKQDAELQIEEQAALTSILNERPASFDLLSYVDQTIRKNNLTDRASIQRASSQLSTRMQPIVQLELNNVSLNELVDLLHEFYSSKNLIAMYKMNYIRPASANQGLSCNLLLATINI